VVKVCEDINIDIAARDIDRAHRIGKNNAIIVKFFAFKKRTLLYKNRKKLHDPVKIHLDLTKHRLNLLDEAKAIIPDATNVDFVFADINCNTVAKLKDNRFIFFDSIENFKDILTSTS